MEEEEAEQYLLYILLRRIINRRRKSRKPRKFWVHPVLNNQLLGQQFYQLHSKLQDDPEKFFAYYKMSERSFNELLSLIRDGITKRSTQLRLAIPPEERLSITIRFLTSGCSYAELHSLYKVGMSTVSAMIKEVCAEICARLPEKVMTLPSIEEWVKISDDLFRKANFPNCIGCVGIKHVRITHPGSHGCKTQKPYAFITVMAICDSNYNFIHVDVGSFDEPDSKIFRDSSFYNQLTGGDLNIPGDKTLPGSTIVLPHVVIGDETFDLSKNLLKPYAGRKLPESKSVFNYRLGRARRFIDCSFAIMTNKWKILHRPLNVSVNFAEVMVKAICMLHNFVISRDGFEFEDTLTVHGLVALPNGNTARGGAKQIINVRNKFAEYFMSPEGELPWQYVKANG